MSRISVIICLLAVIQELSTPSAATRRSCNHGIKRCERLMRFLQDVLDARNDLTWIDQMAAKMHSKDPYSDPELQDKINAMFLINTKSVAKDYTDHFRERRKRNFNHTEGLKEKLKVEVDLDDELKNSTTTTTEDPLQKLLKSINVFPVENNITKVNETNRSRIGRSLKSIASDKPRSRSRTKKAVYGDLAKEIVEEVLNEVKNKEGTGGISANILHPKTLNSFVAENINQDQPDLENDKDSFAITHKLVHLCQKLIAEEVEKKSCVPLPPDLREFLIFLLNAENDQPATKNQVKKSVEYSTSLGEWYHKNAILNDLLDEYDILTRKDKKKVQAIYEYLVSRHAFIQSCIEAFSSRSVPAPT